MHAVKSVNFELESWLGIRNFGFESEIFYKKPWDFESYTRFQLGVGPLGAVTVGVNIKLILYGLKGDHRLTIMITFFDDPNTIGHS